MKVTQAHVGLPFFQHSFLSKYKLKPLSDYSKPAIVFGCSVPFIMKIKAPVIAIWTGSDAYNLFKRRDLADLLNTRTDVRNIALSSFVSNTLGSVEISNEILPITPVNYDSFQLKPLGNCVYYYGSPQRPEIYGLKLFELVKQKLEKKFRFIHVADPHTHSPDKMSEIYEKCFCGLRLTVHDGLPNTVVELAVMGRRSVFNGDIPTVESFTNPDSIINFILRESRRKHPSKNVREQMLDYINIGDDWMHL